MATPARANVTVSEIYPVPAGGVYAIEGHGWGHGRGLSQYGAKNAGSMSPPKTADQITAFYYPGTVRATQVNYPMRVRLMADNDSDTRVYAATGLTVTDSATKSSITLPTNTGATLWRSVTDSGGLHLQGYIAGAWQPLALGGKTTLVGPLVFSGPTFVRLSLPDGTSRDYRGALQSVRLSAAQVASVDALPMESYLLGVVPRESPSSWPTEALKAQAIAARSYSEYKREHIPSGQFFDICDTTMCQVYGGSAAYSSSGTRTSLEPASTTSAVQATAGVIRAYNGKAIFAEFSSSNGGWSTADPNGIPYLIAQRDDWDGLVASSVHSWKGTLTAAAIQARFPAVGHLLRMRVTARDGNGEWRGRVKTVVLEGVNSSGVATSVTTTGAEVYHAHIWPASSDGLRSSWWHVIPSYNSLTVGQSVAPRLVRSPGVSTGKLTVTVKNTGTVAWPTSTLHLVVASPPGEADPLVGNSTIPGTYAGTATSIPPDSTAAFSFALTGDGVSPGLYARSYRLRIGSGAVFGSTVSWRVQVDAPAFLAAPVSGPTSTAAASGSDPNAPGPVLADGRSIVVPISGSTPLRFTIRNAGNITWPVQSGGPVRLGTTLPFDRTSVSSGTSWLVSGTRPSAIAAAAPVAPGQTGTLALELYGQRKPVGVTTEAFQPVWDGKRWISGATATLKVVRVDPTKPRLATVDLAPASKVNLTTAPNGTAVLIVWMRNVGGQAWPVGTERLGSTATPLATSAWPSSTRPPALTRNVTRPTIAAVYPGEVGEWRVPLSAFTKSAGTYNISLRPVTAAGAAFGPAVTTTVTVVKAQFTGSVVRVSSTRSVPRNGTAVTLFDVKNTGNMVWPVGGKVQSVALQAGGSPSHATTWLTPLRPGPVTVNVSRPGAKEVRPGEVARFLFALAGNGRTPRTTSEPFGVIWPGWLQLVGVRPTISYSIV